MTNSIRNRRRGSGKPIAVLALVAIIAGSFYVMTQEQDARDYCQNISSTLMDAIGDEESLTPEQVHEKVGAEPTVTRTPAKHRLVEEYTKKGPLNSYTVYAYYETAATQLLEAVSLNKKLDDWESED